MISVDITRSDLKAAHTCYNMKGLAPRCRELKLNPVVRAGGVASPGLNASKVRAEVAVEIRDRKRLPRSNRSERSLLGIRVCCCRAANKTKEQQ